MNKKLYFHILFQFQKKKMHYTPHLFSRQNGNKFTVTFGDPISYTTFNSSKTPKEWAAWLKEQTMALVH